MTTTNTPERATARPEVTDTMLGILLEVDFAKGDYRHLRSKWTPLVHAMLDAMPAVNTHDALQAENERLREQVKELRGALRPFAGLPELSEAETAVPNESPVTIRCQLGDIRRAYAALLNPQEPNNG